MKLFSIAFLFLIVTGVYCQKGITVDQLGTAINDIISQSIYNRMEWGILIEAEQSDGSYETIYSLNADQYFVPASNNKVITTAPAYLYFGNDFVYNTPFISDSAAKSNLNNACFIGRGDPSIQLNQVEKLAQQIANSGVSSIKNLVYDDTFFPTFPSAWEWEDVIATYGAQPNSLILSQNAVTISVAPGRSTNSSLEFDFGNDADNNCMGVVNMGITISSSDQVTEPLRVFYRIGDNRIYITGQLKMSSTPESFSFAVLQPADRFQCSLNYYLSQNGVTISNSNQGKCHNTTSWSNIGMIQSEYTYKDTMNYTLQESDNLFAECFLRTLGAYFNKPENSNAQSNGFAAVRTILASYGVDVSTFVQDDGSGLSRHNLVSPRAMAAVLEMMGRTPNGATYRSFLPVAGESGTLENRFVGTPAQGIVQAKTGTVSGCSSLSGYVDASTEFPQIVFSIIGNFSDQSASVIREGIDSIVILLTQLVPSS